MSCRKDILSCIDVTIMDRSANAALPSSYSKTLPALRASAAVAHATGLGRKRFVDLIEPHACVSALIPEHGSKRTPPGIQHRLGLPGFGQGRGIHVANEDRTVTSNDVGAQFLQEVFPAIRDLGVQGTHPRPLAGALRATLSLSGLKAEVFRGEV